MKKIIYTTDFSENSVAALKYTYQIGKLLKADIIVLHIFDPDDLKLARTAAEKKQIIKHHHDRLQKFCSLNLQDNFENLDLSLAVLKGEDVARTILQFVRDMDALMIVMGTCGSGTVKDFILGSTTTDVISGSSLPVLAIPGDYKFTGLREVIYATDLEEEAIYNICKLLKIFGPLLVQFSIVHIAANKKTEANDLMDWFKELLYEKTSYPKLSFKILYSQDIINALVDYYSNVKADMVVMMEHKSKLNIQNVLHRDLVKRMQTCTRVPLLSVREIH